MTLVLTHTGPAKPRPAPSVIELSPGTYVTTINIHNPSLGRNPVTIYKRAVVALPESATAIAPSAFQSVSLLPGYAVEIDCADIATLLADATSGEGFVTILATSPLDVVGVYTASGTDSKIAVALEMLNITPRIEVLGRATTVAAPGPIYEYSAKFLCVNAIP